MNDVQRRAIVSAAALLREAERPIRVLNHVAWAQDVKERFFATKARELPQVEYPAFTSANTVTEALDRIEPLAAEIDEPVRGWIERQASTLRTAANMLQAAGTPAFFRFSKQLYGEPREPLPDGKSTSLGLARAVDRLSAQSAGIDLGAPDPACHLPDAVAQRIQEAVTRCFGDAAPEVVVVDELSSNALASPERIRIRRGACFTDRDALQLIQHEAFVHVCTSLNGLAQEQLPVLGASHPGTTRTQEGLAVFGELISGTLEPNRFRRLADRVLAIQMALEGADFLEVYRFFLERTDDESQSFENARRVFRGGVLTGGAPFTKDDVYLDGLLRVTTFMRAAVAEGRTDCLTLLFTGKLDLEDIPALAFLREAGLIQAPRFLPPWMSDRRFLVSYLTFSRFLGRMDLDAMRQRYRKLLEKAPKPAVSPPAAA